MPLFWDFTASAGTLGTNERCFSFQGSVALVTMWFLGHLAKLWLKPWLSFSSLFCNKKVRSLAFVLDLLSCFHLEQAFHTACYLGQILIFFMLCYKIHCTVLKSSPVETTLCLLEARAFFSFLTPTLSAFCFMCFCVLCNCCTDASPVLLPSPRRHVGSCGLCPGSLVCSVHHRSP